MLNSFSLTLFLKILDYVSLQDFIKSSVVPYDCREILENLRLASSAAKQQIQKTMICCLRQSF